MKKNSFDKLIKMYQQGKLSDDKKKLMDDWLNTFQENDTMDSVWKDSEIKALEKSILRKIEKKDSIRIQKLRRIYALCGLVAASIILIIGFWWTNHNAAYKINEGVMISSDQIFPHEDAVILSIGEKKIELASDKGGINFSDSELTYEDGTQILTKSESTKQVEWYELNIPKGKQYQATLPDGTKVWLNAASTLKYPSNFNESVREVELQGEAFFDVVKKQYAKDNNMKTPFIVKSATQSIKVLGTQFNISAYSNTDRIETSLLEGVVEVADNNGNRKVLRPNQQSVIDLKKGGIRIHNIDAASVAEWRNNLFVFHGVNLKHIMKEVERWYGVNVNIDEWPNDLFYGEVQRDMPLSEVLKMVEMSSKLKFKVITVGEERRLIML